MELSQGSMVLYYWDLAHCEGQEGHILSRETLLTHNRRILSKRKAAVSNLPD